MSGPSLGPDSAHLVRRGALVPPKMDPDDEDVGAATPSDTNEGHKDGNGKAGAEETADANGTEGGEKAKW